MKNLKTKASESSKTANILGDKESIMRMHQKRNANITRFRKEFPQFKHLTNQQISLIFKMYK